jgi:1-aminocyclopropane-1-carboxylate deaminase/D-cysteine desulfhydrase-like pyridoxal-dependent ACC family enzyme
MAMIVISVSEMIVETVTVTVKTVMMVTVIGSGGTEAATATGLDGTRTPMARKT